MLAIYGGSALNRKVFEWNSSIGEEETRAVLEVMQSKVLSDFLGAPGDRFLGGKKVQELDRAWAEAFRVEHAVSVNSATSGLYAAIGALGLGAGDEVIVPPLTMSATAVCVLAYQAVPVFADLEPDFFCLDPASVEKKIGPKTRAIIAVNLFGQPAALRALKALAKKHKLYLIEDNAQAPGALHHGEYAGTVGDIGIFSLNCHKAIQCGEGGVVVTQDPELALRLQLIRNHAESVVEGIGYENLVNMVGHNYRITELQAAIAIEQLKKLRSINAAKQELATLFTEELKRFPFLTPPRIRPDSTHVYYLYVLKYDAHKLHGLPRDLFIRALNAEGYNASFGYVKPLYLLPLFQKKVAFPNGQPFQGKNVSYDRGLCPVAEALHFEEIFYPNLIRYRVGPEDVKTFATAVEKVAEHALELKRRGA